MGLRLLVGIRFQVLFHSGPPVLFTFPSRYSSLSVVSECFALDGGPPCFPPGSSCPAVLWIPARFAPLRLRESHPLRCTFPDASAAQLPLSAGPQPPLPKGNGFGLFPFRSPLLGESLLITSPRATEMFQFTRLSSLSGWHGITRAGLPHSDVHGSMPACGSPCLFAACHVLLRLETPRHPPYALSSLTCSETVPRSLRLRLPGMSFTCLAVAFES